MNRRGFLAILAGAALDPERLLWVPGRKLISIPKSHAAEEAILKLMLNHFMMMQEFQKIAIAELQNRLLFGQVKGAGFFRASDIYVPEGTRVETAVA